jgi:hypothetical protein
MDIGNYRLISLLCTLFKILTRILTKRVSEIANEQLPVEQAGFRPTYSTVDHIMNVNLLTEKCREWALPLHMAFIDFKKAFDSIEFNVIWEALEHYNVDECTIRMIKQLYAVGTSSVAVANSSAQFNIQRGVRQGDSLSPLLFILTLQFALDRIQWSNRGYKIGNNRLRYLAYADDMVLFSANMQELQSMLDDVAGTCRQIGLEINVAKTNFMSTNADAHLELNGLSIGRVSEFIYLGHKVMLRRDHNKELGRRIGAAWGTFKRVQALLTDKNIPMKIKRRYFNMCTIPALLYGCETWALTQKTEQRLGVCQRAMERRMLGVRLIDKRRISWIRRKTGLDEIIATFRKRKWKHASKMLKRANEHRWDIRLLNWTPPTTRPLGRPATRWQNVFKEYAGQAWMAKAKRDAEWTRLLPKYTMDL